MLEPEYLLRITEESEQISEFLHQDIIKRIVERMMLRIGRGEDYLLTATDKWQIQTLQDAGYLLEDIQKEIAKRTKQQEKAIKEAFEDAGIKTIEYDDEIYRSVGLSTVPLTQSPQLIRIMQDMYERTLHEWKNYTRTTAEASQRAFINELDKIHTLVSTGALSYTQAVREGVNNIVSHGTEVIYPSGHVDAIETATLRAVRTGISQMSAQIQIARMKENKVGLVITTSHLGARPSHQEWQGQVFSIDWKKMNKIFPLPEIPTPENLGAEDYPDFVDSTRIGKIDGLCGINCRHNFSVFYQGMENPFEQYDSEENLKQYEKEQRQRVLERRIRNTKAEVIGLKESIDKCADEKARFELDMDYQRKSALLQKQNKMYNDYCKENDLKKLSDRISIAKWDRKQAAAARGAAQRYNNAK